MSESVPPIKSSALIPASTTMGMCIALLMQVNGIAMRIASMFHRDLPYNLIQSTRSALPSSSKATARYPVFSRRMTSKKRVGKTHDRTGVHTGRIYPRVLITA
jgi:hypothetical protein